MVNPVSCTMWQRRGRFLISANDENVIKAIFPTSFYILYSILLFYPNLHLYLWLRVSNPFSIQLIPPNHTRFSFPFLFPPLHPSLRFLERLISQSWVERRAIKRRNRKERERKKGLRVHSHYATNLFFIWHLSLGSIASYSLTRP